MQTNEVRFYDFGEYRLDVRRRVLTKNGEQIALKNRHLDLLLALVENEGRVLSHDELIEKVWDGAFIEGSNIKKGISALRQILDESPADSAFIKTVPRKGYVFVAPVRALPNDAETVFYRESETEILIEEIEIAEENNASAANSQPITASAINGEIEKTEPSTSAFINVRTAIASVLILILMGGFVWISKQFFALKASAIDFNQMQIVPLTTFGNVGGGNISRSGELFYFAAKEREMTSIWLKNLKTGIVRQIFAPQKINIYASDFAPDEKSIYFWLVDDKTPDRNGVYQIEVAGGEMRKISDKQWAGMRFSPDGKRIAYWRGGINEQNESGLFTANPDGGDEKLIFSFDGKLNLSSVDWTPDGNFLTYVARRNSDNQNQYFIAQVPKNGGAEQAVVSPGARQIFSAFWMPDGNGLIVSALDESSKMQQVWYLSYPSGEWRRITSDLSWYWAARPTADGKGIFVSQQRDVFNLWIGEGNGQNFRQITFDTIFYHPDISWLSDETILFAAKTEDNNEIWEMSADGKNRRQITFNSANDRYPQAAPDGERILFLSDRSGTTQIWQMRHAGGDAKQVTNAATDVGRFRILPDGQSIVYSMQVPGRGWTFFRKTIDGDDFQLLPFSDASGLWDVSPDGREIAYLAKTKSGERVRVSPLEENKPKTEFDFGDFNRIVWTKDGKALLRDGFYRDRKEIIIQPLVNGESHALTNFNSDEQIWNFDLSPSGKRIATRRVRQFLDVMLIKFDSN
jgi:Tol biopolymer transport system component/DNA-binding winged helix-turn-helix (wHTH) protein